MGRVTMSGRSCPNVEGSRAWLHQQPGVPTGPSWCSFIPSQIQRKSDAGEGTASTKVWAPWVQGSLSALPMYPKSLAKFLAPSRYAINCFRMSEWEGRKIPLAFLLTQSQLGPSASETRRTGWRKETPEPHPIPARVGPPAAAAHKGSATHCQRGRLKRTSGQTHWGN